MAISYLLLFAIAFKSEKSDNKWVNYEGSSLGEKKHETMYILYKIDKKNNQIDQ